MMKSIERCFLGSAAEKITNRVLVRSIVMSVGGILLSIVFLTSATWAWFCGSVSSGGNVIKGATCTVSVLVTAERSASDVGSTTAGGIVPDTISNDKYSYTFQADRLYEITLIATGTAKSSYCYLKIGDRVYYTQQIPTTGKNSISFKVRFSAETKAELVTCWGTYGTEDRTFYDNESYHNLVRIP